MGVKIDRIIVDNRRAEVSSAESQMPRALHEIVILQCLKLNYTLLKSQNLEVK